MLHTSSRTVNLVASRAFVATNAINRVRSGHSLAVQLLRPQEPAERRQLCLYAALASGVATARPYCVQIRT